MPDQANQLLADANQKADDAKDAKPNRIRHVVTLLVIFCLILAYPLAVTLSHKVTNQIPDTVPTKVWADARIGTAIELLERESFFGWAESQPVWHPHSRLTAMPAYQLGLAEGLAGFVNARSTLSSKEQPISDLVQANILLRDLTGADAEDRLYATIQALKRYDGLKARSLVDDVTALQTLRSDIVKFQELLRNAETGLRQTASKPSRGVFNRADVHQYYKAKGTIHALGMILRSYGPDTIKTPGFEAALTGAQTAFFRASLPSPLTVSNPQPGEFSLGGNDFMTLAFLTSEARQKLEAIEDIIAPALTG